MNDQKLNKRNKTLSVADDRPFMRDYSPLMEDKFIRLVEGKSGIVFDNVKRRELKQNISRCMQELGEDSFQNYYQRLTAETTAADGKGVSKELKKLINFMTINETYFFRDRVHFEMLQNTALPELMQQKKEKGDIHITVWSAGASSGEEVYSIIMTLLEIPELENYYQLEVLGTDINENMLHAAEKGIYSGRTLDKVPQYILQKYFDPFNDRYKIKKEVKQYARFHYLNLTEPFSQLQLNLSYKPDIIFFRNVLIYFNRETCQRTVETFYHLLSDGGFLFLGPSETLWDISDRFELIMFDRAYIYRKRG